MTADDYVSLKEAQRRTGCSEKTILRKAVQGDIPVAVYAHSWIVQASIMNDRGKLTALGRPERLRGAWMYLEPELIRNFLDAPTGKIETGVYRSTADGPPDRWATVGGNKPRISLKQLRVPLSSLSQLPSKGLKSTGDRLSSELKNKQVRDLFELAVAEAIHMKVSLRLAPKRISVKMICRNLVGRPAKFSDGTPITLRWRTAERPRQLLRGELNPLADPRYRNAKPDQARFNP